MAGLIEDYALVGDMQSAALISRDGCVDWLCLPRFDSDACFAALLGDETNGQWRLSPTAAGGPAPRRGETSRRYEDGTLILETTWRTMSGVVRVTDFMPPRDGEQPVLVRIVTGVEGSVEMETVLRVRFGYGRVLPWMRRVDHCLSAVAGPDSVWLRTPVRLTGKSMRHEGGFVVRAGEQVPFVLCWMPSHAGAPEVTDADAGDLLARTREFWAGFTAACTYTGEYREAVLRSLITLKALTYAPTGGIVAAPTTSLPEDLGGVRNWDYRYCWLRDATITLEALLRTGYTAEAAAWREWLERAVAGSPRDVQIMYGVAGERRLAEWEATWLPGYEDSAPVRIGNAAVDQRQLDVYGEVIDAITLGKQAGLRFDKHTWALVRQLLEFLEKHWDEPDEGIWEVRGPRRHFVHSKIMAWVAFDRACQVAELAAYGGRERWAGLRDKIHAEICARGYDAERGTFTQYYGSSELDASVLLMIEVGFLPPDDPRVVSTVRVIQRDLVRDGLVLRYTQPSAPSGAVPGSEVDGLVGGEGAFLACSFWLVNALHLIGDYPAAVELFERLLTLRNDVGLLSEEYDSRYGRQVGNTPQAFSHVPLIQAALNLHNHEGHHCRVPAGRRRDRVTMPARPHILVVNGRKVRQPVFVIGAPYSGTDLLAAALKQAPGFHVTIGQRSVLGVAYAFARTPSIQRGRDEAAATVLRDAFAQAWQVTPASCLECSAECREAGGVNGAGSCIRERDIVRYGDATPDLMYCADAVVDAFGDARIVQLIRDGRDVTAAMLSDAQTLGFFRRGMISVENEFPNPFFGIETEQDLAAWPELSTAGKCAMRWLGCVRKMARLRSSLAAEQLTTLRYEQLIRDPAGSLAAVSQFIGAQVHPPRIARQQALEPGGWRRVLTASQLADFEKVAGTELRRVGYS